ncbi:MAG TPA: GNAT family N-acetyltransferase, partial [Ktedonobacteraceae bacterium]|nr:GNAT family N-acetyltransferase [Ktedonobacteraceae bacterium]
SHSMSAIPDTTTRLKDGTTITIRTARPEDARRLLDHARAAFAEGEFLLSTLDDFRMTEEQETAWLQANLDDPSNLVIVAEYEGRITGMLDFHSEKRKRVRHHGELGMSVNRAWRDRGVGRALLRTLIAWAEQHPVLEKLCLQVFATNTRAIALYSSLGFEEEGRQVRDIKLESGEYVDVLMMALFVK